MQSALLDSSKNLVRNDSLLMWVYHEQLFINCGSFCFCKNMCDSMIIVYYKNKFLDIQVELCQRTHYLQVSAGSVVRMAQVNEQFCMKCFQISVKFFAF